MFSSIGGRSVIVIGGGKGVVRGDVCVFAGEGAPVTAVGPGASRPKSTAAMVRRP